MKKVLINILSVFAMILLIASCSSDNECDNACPSGQIQTLTCSCVQDPASIIPHPCPDMTCPAGEVVGVTNGTCSCVEPATEICGGMTCASGEVLDVMNCACVTIATDQSVSGQITEDVTWATGSVIILEDRVTVVDGVSLTIEPGVIVKGQAGTGANATALLIARGGKIKATGSAEAPIVFTTVADEILPGQIASPNMSPDVNGLWGGLIILGNAPISASADAVQIEGIPTSDANGLYGGNDPMDDSGILQYVSVRHGGANIGEGNEINGITFGGVGSGTVVENIEVVGTQDDGLEFFGGTVNVTNAVVWNNGDDAFDTDQAWSGTLSNVVSINPGDSPLELDGPEGSFTSTGHTITGLTSYGAGAGKELFDVDETTDVNLSNMLFFGFAADSKISSDYAAYAANTNGYSVSDIEAIFPDGADAASVFGDAAGLVTTLTTLNQASTGADVSVFGFAWANTTDIFASLAEAQANPEVLVADLPTSIDSDVTLKSGNIYNLVSRTTVTAGATLTIEPGVVLKGAAGTGANASSLLIARGGKLNALGTADAPIIMTSVADDIQPGQILSPNIAMDVNALWGGLIILGNAPISASAASVQIEGIPTSDANGLYGGSDPMDNSGTIQYVSVRHGGTNIGEGNEINGITFGGVGSGTVVENVEVLGTQDDGLEFFGGTVNVTNAIVLNNGDDAFDTDQAWAGTLDNAISINPGDSPLELDGPEGDYMSTGHTIQNLTSYGTASGKELFDVDASTDISMNNLFFYGFANDATISSDYSEYAANTNGFAITNIQALLPEGIDVATIFGDAAGLVTPVTAVSEGMGADASAFGWTATAQGGVLTEIGL